MTKIQLLTLSPCVLIQKYLHVAGLDLGLDLEVLASTSAFCPRLTSLLLATQQVPLSEEGLFSETVAFGTYKIDTVRA